MKYLIECTEIYSDKYVVEASSEEEAISLLEEAIIEGSVSDPMDCQQVEFECLTDESRDSTINLKSIDVKKEE